MVRGAGGIGRGFLVVLSGTAGAQLLTFLLLPVLSRLYPPDSFGALSLVLAVSGLIVPVAMLRLEGAALLPRSEREVRALVFTALCSGALVSVLAVIVTWSLSLLRILDLDDNPTLPIWIGILTFLTSCYALLSQVALREKSYTLVARTSFLQAIGVNGMQLALALISREGWALLLGASAGRTIGLGSLWRATARYVGATSGREVRAVLAKYWRFPLIFTPSHFLNALGVHGPVVIVTFMFGIESAGQLGMAERVASAPLMLIGVSMGQVFTAELGRIMREDARNARWLFLRTSAHLAIVALAVGALLSLLGPWLVPTVLGSEWAPAGECIQAMALTVAVRLVANPITSVLVVFQLATATVVLDALRVALLAAAIAAVITLDLSLVQAVWMLYGSMAICYIATWFYCLRVVTRRTTEHSST